jgi:hypothetical protein
MPQFHVIGTIQFTTEVNVEAESEDEARIVLMAAVNRTITDALNQDHVVSAFEWTNVVVRAD